MRRGLFVLPPCSQSTPGRAREIRPGASASFGSRRKKTGGLLPKINPKFARDFCVFRRRCARYCHLRVGPEVAIEGVNGTLRLLGVTESLGRREKLGMVLHPQPEQPMAFAGDERPAPLATLPQTGSLQREWRRCGKPRCR
jgi:hypothetical protein